MKRMTLLIALMAVGCGDNGGTGQDASTGRDLAGADLSGAPPPDMAGVDLAGAPKTSCTDPTRCKGGPGTIVLSASGEVLSLAGYPWPPMTAMDTVFVDGWKVVFQRLLITVDKIMLWSNPDMVPADQSMHGPAVAQLNGPWVIDLHKGGPLVGKGGPMEQAVPFAGFDAQDNGQPFDSTQRYAFGYDLVPATAGAINVNLDAAGMADYQVMQQKGYTVLYVGTATWVGTPDCTSQCTAATCSDPTFKFNTGVYADPTPTVKFYLGYKTPTSYVNCQNPDISGMGVNGEDHPRGVQVKTNAQIVAQVTIHTDHPLWENYDSDGPPIHFDQLAVAAKKQPDNTWLVQNEDLIGENWTAFPVPWRYCNKAVTLYAPPDTNTKMDFEGTKLNLYNPALTGNLMSTTQYRDYYDLTSHVQSTQGHLNSNGLCAVTRHFQSPP